MPLYESIKSDNRHNSVILLKKGDIAQRNFPDWYMGYKNVDTQDMVIQSKATEQEKKNFNATLKSNREKTVLNAMFKGTKSAASEKEALSVLTKFYDLI